MRGFYPQGTDSVNLRPNTTNDENTASFHLTSDGFYYSSSYAPYIYMAIRRPHKPPTAATEVFAIDTGSGSSTIPTWDSGFPVDFATLITPASTTGKLVSARLMGPESLRADSYFDETNDIDLVWDSNTGWGKDYTSTKLSHMFKRAPGFMDVMGYTGDNTARAYNHNLGVKPELILRKSRSGYAHWIVYSATLGAGYYLSNSENHGAIGGGSNTTAWNNTEPTATQFTVGGSFSPAEPFLVVLFATLSGISKVGSYTGTGNAINVDCGFSSGARFILIKRTDAGGDWFVYDTARGIISGNDPYFLLNTTAAEVTNTDYIDPLSSGFTVTSSAPTGLNASGGTYIFLAIA